MKVWRWVDTDNHHIAILRPDELFDLTTIQWPDPDAREVPVRALNVVSRETETYGMAYNKKGWPRAWWESIFARSSEQFADLNTEQLAQLKDWERDNG